MANPFLSCDVCGEPLPKYTLDRYSVDLCGEYCAGKQNGRAEGMQLLQALQDWALAIKDRCHHGPWLPGATWCVDCYRATKTNG